MNDANKTEATERDKSMSIPARLRAQANQPLGLRLFNEAADEIERLQASVDDAYARVEQWQRDFLKRRANGDLQYYADAASGLNIALQEIDHDRWERSSKVIWDEYQQLLRENGRI